VARKRFFAKPAKVIPGASAAADARAAAAAARVASINLQAMTGRSDIHQGSRVIIGSGLGAGELATVESVIGGVIPAALVRTDAGMARRVRTIDLTPAPAAPPPAATPPAATPPAAPASATPSTSPADEEPKN
jgi:hypothetical protein